MEEASADRSIVGEKIQKMGAKQPIVPGQKWQAKLRQVPWMRSFLDRWMTPPMTPASAEYESWQQRFLLSRLGLCLWLALLIVLTFFARDVYDYFFALEELKDVPQAVKALWFPIDFTLVLLLIGGLVLHRTQFGQRHPAALFLSLSWVITILPQIFATQQGFPLPDILAWSLVFLVQATLIPVHWELHLVSQVGLLVYFYGVNAALGLTTVPAPPGRPEQSIFILTVILYLLWFCFICDLAVYLYERLQRAEFESRRQSKLFLHAVSHDLRNPVTGTSLVLKNLLKKGDDKLVVSRSVLERMIESNDRQLALINSLLEVHNSDVRGIDLHLQPIVLSGLVDSVISDLEPLLTENQASLLNQISPTLSQVNADKTQLWRVFCNLIANALHHNPPGITLTLTAVPEVEMVRVSVQDNGVGMSQAESDRVFDLYTRGSQARRTVGLGLGLYLCRQIIIAHGGKIGVESAPDAGATFWFTLPMVRWTNP